ncbi:MAG: DDE-type integrase/transposase/recombinase [Opitutaceae bacterium]|jgi:transposase InsO family protein
MKHQLASHEATHLQIMPAAVTGSTAPKSPKIRRNYTPIDFAIIRDFDLEKYILDARLCPDAENYLREAFLKPSRHPSGYLSHTIHYPCVRWGRSLKSESRDYEYAFGLTKIYRPDVLCVLEQAPKIEFRVEGVSIFIEYTPDFLVITHHGIEIWEVRPSSRLSVQFASKSNRYTYNEETGTYDSPAVRDYFKKWNFTYRIATERDIHARYCNNVNFIHPYIQGYPENPISENEKNEFLAYVRGNSGLKLIDIPTSNPTRRTELALYLIARAEIFISFSEADFQKPELLRLHATAQDEEAFYQYINISRPRPANLEELGYRLRHGSFIEINGEDYKVTSLTQTLVRLRSESGIEKDFPHQVLLDLKPRIGRIYEAEKTFENIYNSATIEQKLTQLCKSQKIAPYQPGGALERKSPESRTIRRWLKDDKQAKANEIPVVEAQFPKFYKCGRKPLNISNNIRKYLDKLISDNILDPKKTSVEWVWNLLIAKFGESNLPSSRTIYRIIERIDPHTKNWRQGGKRFANKTEPFYGDSDIYGSPHGQKSWQRAHIDSTPTDLRHPNDPRSHLAKMVDAYDGRALAWVLTSENSSELTIRALILDCVARHGALPATISCDFGSEHKNNWLEKTMMSLGVILDFRPKSQPRKGGPVESSFSVLCKELIHNLSGNTKLMKQARLVTKAVNPNQFAIWSYEDFKELLTEYYTLKNDLPKNDYPSPNSIAAACQQKFGPPPCHMPDVDSLKTILLPFVDRIYCTVSDRGTVKCNNHVYGIRGEQNILRHYAGKKIAARWLPDNENIIYVFPNSPRQAICCQKLKCEGPALDIIEKAQEICAAANNPALLALPPSPPPVALPSPRERKAAFVAKTVAKEAELKKKAKVVPFEKPNEISDDDIPTFNLR